MMTLVVGAGAIGIAIATFLRSQDVQVDILARGKTLQAIRENGIGRNGLFGEYSCPAGDVGAYESYEELPSDAYDM